MADPRIVFDSDSDWLQFTGQYRVCAGVMRLGFKDTAAQLGLTNVKTKYRFGQKQSLAHDGAAGRDAVEISGGGNIVIQENGAKVTGGDAVLKMGGVADDYIVVQKAESIPGGIVQGSVITFWTCPQPGADGTVFGWQQDHVVEPYPYQALRTVFRVRLANNRTLMFYANSGDYGEFPGSSRRGVMDSSIRLPDSIYDGRQHCFVLHNFWYIDALSGLPYWRCRVFVDGYYVDDLVDSTAATFGTATSYAISPRGGPTPTILGIASREHQYTWNGEWVFYPPYNDWGNQSVSSSWSEPMDEVVFARCHIALVDGQLATGPAWQPGAKVFSVVRHPRVSPTYTVDLDGGVPLDHSVFIMAGPVIDTAVADATIQSMTATITGGRTQQDATNHTRVMVSARASADSFAVNDANLPWSEWVELSNGVQTFTGCRGQGRYVQVRVRILPSDDSLASTSPGIDRLEIRLSQDEGSGPEQDGVVDIPAKLSVNGYYDFRAKIMVQSPGETLIPAKLFAFYRGTELIPAKLLVAVRQYVDIPAAITAVQPHLIPAKIRVTQTEYTVDIPAKIEIQRNSVDIPAKIDVKQRQYVDIPAKIDVTWLSIPAKITVVQRGVFNVPARIKVLPDTPGPVPGLSADVPAATWQPNFAIHAAWLPAQPKHAGVVGYYYTVSPYADADPSTSWVFTANTFTDINIDYSGKWFLLVAAYNEIGQFGPVASYAIWYNHAPTNPGSPTVNGLDSVNGDPFVSKYPVGGHTLAWSASTDADPSDISKIVYEVQVASQANFGADPNTGQTSIVTSWQNLQATDVNLSILPNYSRLYWRIRASDGKQSSDWSPVGSFRVNQPPGRVTNLAAQPV